MRKTAILALVTSVAACQDLSEPVGPASYSSNAAATAHQLADRFIVVLHDDVPDPEQVSDELIRTHGGTKHYQYRYSLRGFAATLPPQAVEAIRRNPRVRFVEQDGIAYAIGTQLNPPSWGLDRIDQHALPLDATYNYGNDGTGVRAYILDTGVRPTHEQYAGRVTHGWDFIDNDADASDCHGHGTHVAGTVGGTTVGVAKNVRLVSVRVLGCGGSGTWSQVIAGIDWVTGNAIKPAVANMSLGGGLNSAVNTAVNNSVAAGVVYAVAAGNSNADACVFSPASAASALTVGATTISDARSSFSNFGTCLDVFAPGSAIYSSTNTGNNTYESWNGTSMATPHVAGVAALYLATNTSASPAQVANAINTAATPNVVTSAGTGSPNLLLYSLIGGEPPPPPTGAIHSGDLDGVGVSLGKGSWTARVTFTVHNSSEQPVAGATVRGTWSTAAGEGSCVTGSDGTCTIAASVSKHTLSVGFMLSSISAEGAVYDSAANHDDEGDSAPPGTGITVRKP
jgi:subtilisin family serine protease